MSSVRDISVGFATAINGAGIATLNSSYVAGQTPILFKSVPSTPDRVVVITVVPRDDSPNLPMGSVMVQVRVRGLPNNALDTDDLGDSIFDLIQNTTNVVWGSQHIVQCIRQVSVPLGQDSLERWERADQYYLDIDTPGTTNRPATGN